MRVFLFARKENHSFKSLRLFLKAKKQPPVCLRPGKREKYWPFYFIVLYVYHGCLFLLFVLLKSHRLNTKWLWYEIVALVHKNPNSGPYRKDGFSHECDTFCGFLRSDLSAPARFYFPVSICPFLFPFPGFQFRASLRLLLHNGKGPQDISVLQAC